MGDLFDVENYWNKIAKLIIYFKACKFNYFVTFINDLTIPLMA